MINILKLLFKSKPKVMNGIDVSHHNGFIDWPLVIKNNPKIDFAYIKATEGATVIDSKGKFNAIEAKNHYLKIGYYHFATLNREDEVPDAIEEAKFFMKVISDFPKSDLPLVLDIESMNPKVDLDPHEVLAYINAFFGELAKNGYEYALYSYTPFLDAHLPANHNLSDVRLWIAQYNNKPYPRMPKGWEKYWIWQYSDSGKVSGISTKTDLNKTDGII